MSAISGIVNTHGKDCRDVITAMMHSQLHRGPDDNGIFTCEDAAFAHCRLAIIDLAGGKQPLVSSDGRVVAVVDGEIYNYRELRRKLIGTGHNFHTESDAETLLHLYENYGAECISQIDGMFAFAIFDCQKRKLLLGRDRLGQKPLHYFMGYTCFCQ